MSGRSYKLGLRHVATVAVDHDRHHVEQACTDMLRLMLATGQHYCHPQVARIRADEADLPQALVRMGIGA